MKHLKKLSLMGFMMLLAVIVAACGSSGSSNKEKESKNGKNTDTLTDQLADITIGKSITVKGVTVTVNAVKDGPKTSGSPTYEVDVMYKNNSGKNINASPYDWSTALHNGSDKAHVGGKSFNTKSIGDGKEWHGSVTLWKGESPEKVKFESSFLNINSEDNQATWVINNEK